MTEVIDSVIRNVATTGSEANGSGVFIRDQDRSKVLFMLIDTYKSMVTPIRELCTNALEVSEKVELHIDTNHVDTSFIDENSKKINNAVIKIVDHGSGMSREFLETVFLGAGASTKDGVDGAIGGFGIGAKSVLSITDQATWRTTKDGVTSVLILSRNGTKTDHYIETFETDEPNGTTVIVPVDGETAHRIKAGIHSEFLDYQDPDRITMFVNGEMNPLSGKFSNMEIGEFRIGGYSQWASKNTTVTIVNTGGIPYVYDIECLFDKLRKEVVDRVGYDNINLSKFHNYYRKELIVRLDISKRYINPHREALKPDSHIDDMVVEAFVNNYVDALERYEADFEKSFETRGGYADFLEGYSRDKYFHAPKHYHTDWFHYTAVNDYTNRFNSASGKWIDGMENFLSNMKGKKFVSYSEKKTKLPFTSFLTKSKTGVVFTDFHKEKLDKFIQEKTNRPADHMYGKYHATIEDDEYAVMNWLGYAGAVIAPLNTLNSDSKIVDEMDVFWKDYLRVEGDTEKDFFDRLEYLFDIEVVHVDEVKKELRKEISRILKAHPEMAPSKDVTLNEPKVYRIIESNFVESSYLSRSEIEKIVKDEGIKVITIVEARKGAVDNLNADKAEDYFRLPLSAFDYLRANYGILYVVSTDKKASLLSLARKKSLDLKTVDRYNNITLYNLYFDRFNDVHNNKNVSMLLSEICSRQFYTWLDVLAAVKAIDSNGMNNGDSFEMLKTVIFNMDGDNDISRVTGGDFYRFDTIVRNIENTLKLEKAVLNSNVFNTVVRHYRDNKTKETPTFDAILEKAKKIEEILNS